MKIKTRLWLKLVFVTLLGLSSAFAGSRYQIIQGNFTWEQAKADAEARGGHLATITSETEKTEMIAELGGSSSISGWAYWIGANYDSGSWKWITQESWSYTDWASGEGQGGDQLRAVFLGMAQGSGYEFTRMHWGDFPSGFQINYIIEYDNNLVNIQGGSLPQNSQLSGQVVQSFKMGQTEVTWDEWQTIRTWAVANGYGDLADTGSGSAGNHPVRNVNWYDVLKWCNARSQMEGLAPVYKTQGVVYKSGYQTPIVDYLADGYRLPTQAEWEWAARGGTLSQGYLYSGSSNVNQVGWYRVNSSGAIVNIVQDSYGARGTWPVGAKLPNELGIYDMSGNVWEYCLGITDSEQQRIAGGSFDDWDSSCFVNSVIYGIGYASGNTFDRIGFRVARGATPYLLSYNTDSDGDGMSDAQEYTLSNLGFDWQVSQLELVTAYNFASSLKIEVASASTINLSGKSLSKQLVALGGSGPFVWEKTSGTIPPGVTLGADGQLTGTPTTPGIYNFTLKVTNAEGFSAYQSLQIRVVPASTFGGGYNFANFAGSLFGFSGSSDASFLGSGAASGGFTGSADGRTGFTGSADSASRKPLLYAPSGVAVDASGNIYVSDSANNQVRKISTNGAIQNLAGVFTGSGGEDGTKWNARFNNPQGMASDTSGNIYVADQDNHAIRKVTPAGAVSMVAGSFTGSGAAGFSGSADGGGKTTARFNKPSDVAVDAAGNIYVADSGNHAIRKISTNGTVTTLAGTMGAAGNINASGANARFRTPQGIAVDANGTVYVADTGNQVIRRITANGAVSTFAGAAFTGSASPLGGRASFTGSAHAAFIGSADSTNLPASVDGNANTARFSYPTDITIDSAGNLYVTDSGTEEVRRITTNGTVTTLGGSPDGFFYNPLAVAAGANGTIYVADAGNNRIARGIPGASAIAAPVIISEPNDFIDVYGNTSANFSVTATGANLTYQWYRNGIPVSGANASTLLRTASPITEGVYTVAVSNALATEFSEPATLSLRPPAEWDWGQTSTEQPVRPGDSVTFSVDNVTGPGGAISYQWLRNGKPLPGKTSPILMLNSVSLADGGNYALVITTAAGKVTTENQKLVVEDQGALVYKLRGTNSTAHASGKESSKLDGYLVRDRVNNYSYLFWLWPTIKGGGGIKIYSFESRSDITEKSTGPFSGSTSVLRAFAGAGVETTTSNTTIYPDGSVVTEETATPAQPQPNEEMVWISGTDSLITLSPSLKTLAPATMTGQINATYDEEGMVIDMTNITLTLDRLQTFKARTTDNNDTAATLNRLMQEIESRGYKAAD